MHRAVRRVQRAAAAVNRGLLRTACTQDVDVRREDTYKQGRKFLRRRRYARSARAAAPACAGCMADIDGGSGKLVAAHAAPSRHARQRRRHSCRQYHHASAQSHFVCGCAPHFLLPHLEGGDYRVHDHSNRVHVPVTTPMTEARLMQNSFAFANTKCRDLHINSVPFCDFHHQFA
jgi:hypothetical protein